MPPLSLEEATHLKLGLNLLKTETKPNGPDWPKTGTNCPAMTIAVDLGRKATNKQTNKLELVELNLPKSGIKSV